MVKTLKEELRIFLKKGRKRQTKIWKTLANPLKKTEKAIKHVKETIPDLKTEMETIKKTQADEIIEIEIMRKRYGITNASINSRIQ